MKNKVNLLLFIITVLMSNNVSSGGLLEGVINDFASEFEDTSWNDPSKVSAGQYMGLNRKIYSGGGARLRLPVTKINVVSWTPPSINAGCNGMDFTLGSFSFVSSDELIALFRSIAANALSYGFAQALKALNPDVWSLINTIQQKVAHMNKLLGDSCMAAMCAVDTLAETEFIDNTYQFGSNKGTDISGGCSEDYSRNVGCLHKFGEDYHSCIKGASEDDDDKKTAEELKSLGIYDWVAGAGTKHEHYLNVLGMKASVTNALTPTLNYIKSLAKKIQFKDKSENDYEVADLTASDLIMNIVGTTIIHNIENKPSEKEETVKANITFIEDLIHIDPLSTVTFRVCENLSANKDSCNKTKIISSSETNVSIYDEMVNVLKGIEDAITNKNWDFDQIFNTEEGRLLAKNIPPGMLRMLVSEEPNSVQVKQGVAFIGLQSKIVVEHMVLNAFRGIDEALRELDKARKITLSDDSQITLWGEIEAALKNNSKRIKNTEKLIEEYTDKAEEYKEALEASENYSRNYKSRFFNIIEGGL